MSAGREPLAAEPSILHTVEEAAGLLRIGRTIAYSLARRYEDGGGRDRLPVVRLGGCLRALRFALKERAKGGRVVSLSALGRVVSRDEFDDAARSTERALRLADMCDDDARPDRRRDSAVEQLPLEFSRS